jgi:hypothetical protein
MFFGVSIGWIYIGLACGIPAACAMLFLIRRTIYYLCVWLPVVTNLAGWASFAIWLLWRMPDRRFDHGPSAAPFPPEFFWLLIFGPIFVALLIAVCAFPPFKAWKPRSIIVGILVSLIIGGMLVWKLGPIAMSLAHHMMSG